MATATSSSSPRPHTDVRTEIYTEIRKFNAGFKTESLSIENLDAIDKKIKELLASTQLMNDKALEKGVVPVLH